MRRIAILSIIMTGIISLTSTLHAADKGVHLFILSGQSNMVRMDHNRVFTPGVEKAFGKENVVVAKVAQKSQPIRRWYKNWEVTGKQNPKQIGDIYEKLISATKSAIKGKKIKTVTFIWMQGERDSKEGLSDKYEETFLGVLDQIKADLNVKEVNYIIGRLSDAGIGKKHWDKIRKIQMKLSDASPRAAWVNTDDLNDGVMVKGKVRNNDLHYSKEGYDTLAQRYVEKCVELIKKNSK